ncbi:MAG: glycosyltransferase [Candidatus Omnitrophota bacterium]
MKILMVTGSYPPMRCGIGDYSGTLAKTLAESSKIRIGVLTSVSDRGIDKSDKVEVFPVIKKWSLFEILKFVEIVQNWSPNIIHIQYPSQAYGKGLLPWVLPITSFLMRKKVIQTWHEGYSRRDTLKLFLKAVVPGNLVFVRPQYGENLHPSLRWALWKKKATFIPNASVIPRVVLDRTATEVIRKKYLKKQKRLIVFFGFIYPSKGVELLFKIADPALDQIVIAGEIGDREYLLREIIGNSSVEPWKEKVNVVGFLPANEIAELLSAADAVILPFRNGGGEWNTSIHGAVLNGTLVIMTSRTKRGYDKKRNVYYAKIDDISEMRSALASYAGTRREYDKEVDKDEWREIADKHSLLYESLLFREKS